MAKPNNQVTLSELFLKRVEEILGDRTRYWLAKESDISQGSLSRIFSGEAKPGIDTIEAIAKGLNVEPYELLKTEGKIPADILNMLNDQDKFVYDVVRGVLKPLHDHKNRR